MVSIIDLRAVSLKLARNSAPVAEDLAVAEANSVDEQDRIFRLAEAKMQARAVELLASEIGIHLAEGRFNDGNKAKEVRYGYHSADETDHPLLYAELNRGQIDADYAVPEDDEVNGEAEEGVPDPGHIIVRNESERENDMMDHGNTRARQKDRERYRAVMTDPQAQALCFDRKNTRKEVKHGKYRYKEP